MHACAYLFHSIRFHYSHFTRQKHQKIFYHWRRTEYVRANFFFISCSSAPRTPLTADVTDRYDKGALGPLVKLSTGWRYSETNSSFGTSVYIKRCCFGIRFFNTWQDVIQQALRNSRVILRTSHFTNISQYHPSLLFFSKFSKKIYFLRGLVHLINL